MPNDFENKKKYIRGLGLQMKRKELLKDIERQKEDRKKQTKTCTNFMYSFPLAKTDVHETGQLKGKHEKRTTNF